MAARRTASAVWGKSSKSSRHAESTEAEGDGAGSSSQAGLRPGQGRLDRARIITARTVSDHGTKSAMAMAVGPSCDVIARRMVEPAVESIVKRPKVQV